MKTSPSATLGVEIERPISLKVQTSASPAGRVDAAQHRRRRRRARGPGRSPRRPPSWTTAVPMHSLGPSKVAYLIGSPSAFPMRYSGGLQSMRQSSCRTAKPSSSITGFGIEAVDEAVARPEDGRTPCPRLAEGRRRPVAVQHALADARASSPSSSPVFLSSAIRHGASGAGCWCATSRPRWRWSCRRCRRPPARRTGDVVREHAELARSCRRPR